MHQILIICPYRLLPLRGGGALRCFHLLNQLAKYHKIHAVVFQKEEELRSETEGYKIPDTVKIYSPIDTPPAPSFFVQLPQCLGPGLHYRWLRRNLRGPAEGTLLKCYHLIRQILMNHSIDAVVFEHLSAMTAAPIVQHMSPKTIRILDAHNVDHKLIAQEMKSSGSKNKQLNKAFHHARWTEHHLSKSVHSFWACSDADRKTLETINTIKGFTIPNGVDTDRLGFDINQKKVDNKEIIFCGSLAYLPNKDGIQWFYENVWHKIREADQNIKLTIIGSGSNSHELFPRSQAGAWERGKDNSHINFVGEVPDLQPYYQHASVAIVPLRMGSGTRLKILEAMSMGNPIVSTHIGAQGIEGTDGEHILLADDPEEFANAVIRLMSDKALFNQIRQSARELVEKKYNWNVVGETANKTLMEITNR